MSISIKNGFSACAGMSTDGFYGGVLILDDHGWDFNTVPDEYNFDQCVAHARSWHQKTKGTPRRIVLVDKDGQREITVAERLIGPACPKESVESPVIVWIEQHGDQWSFVCYKGGQRSTVLTRNFVMRCPAVAQTDRGLLFSIETDLGPQECGVEVFDEKGRTLYQASGRSPKLCATNLGFVFASETVTPDQVQVRLASFSSETPSIPEESTTLSQGDFLFNYDIGWNESGGSLVIAGESCPAFGENNQAGLYRTLHAWEWSLTGEATELGQLPTEEKAFKSIGMENMPPIKPTVLVDNGIPVIIYKQHRFTGFRGYGWDLHWCRYENGTWTPPVRLTPSTTNSDSTFGLVQSGEEFVGLIPALENIGGNDSQKCSNLRVDQVAFTRDQCLEAINVPDERKGELRIPKSYPNIAPEPPALSDEYKGRQLIWGDLHIHTIYSKCVSAVDGDPREKIRFARDVLGCRVFGVTEHTPHTTGSESMWVYDTLEAESGTDNVLLYASEPGMKDMRHTNWYCRDREQFELLERLFISHRKDYHDTLRQIREDFPADSVFVLRHLHGDAIRDESIPQHFDPHFEVAMEAMQGRANAMLQGQEGCELFPNSFLSAGCKVGLVGGTDHFREWAPNHFCLTGFWVKEVSREGVWEALRNRYTIAMSNSRTAMLTLCKGKPMGSDITLSADESMTISVHASCGHPIRRIALMRNGELLDWKTVDSTEVEIDLTDNAVTSGRHWYVVTAEVETGFDDDTGICHASPYFVWKREAQKK